MVNTIKQTKFYKCVHLSIYKLLPLTFVVDKIYRKKFGVGINWRNPKDINEKINWIKVYGDTSSWIELADKYRVRDYVARKGFAELLVRLYMKWDRLQDVSFKNLPESFILKTNNGSGEVIIVKDKYATDIEEIKRRLSKMMEEPFGVYSGEPHYRKIKPCIIAEELLDNTKQPIRTTSLIDYKVWCFNGCPYCVWTCYDRCKEYVRVSDYDLNWNYHPERSIFTNHYLEGKGIVPKPLNFNLMIEAASKLSEGHPQARVDFYEVDGKLYFGEMTMSSMSGCMDYYTKDYLLELGNQIKLQR